MNTILKVHNSIIFKPIIKIIDNNRKPKFRLVFVRFSISSWMIKVTSWANPCRAKPILQLELWLKPAPLELITSEDVLCKPYGKLIVAPFFGITVHSFCQIGQNLNFDTSIKSNVCLFIGWYLNSNLIILITLYK